MPPAVRRRYRYERLQVRAEGPQKSPTGVWCLCAAMAALVLGTALSFVWLHSATGTTHGLIEKKRRAIDVNNKQLDNLRTDRESFYRGSYIFARVDSLKMGLRQPMPGQVRRLPLDVTGQNRAEYTADGLVSGGADEAADDLAQSRNTAAATPVVRR